MSDHDRRCPDCGEDRLVEFDPVLRRYHCAVCSTTWRRPGRLVPRLTPRLPGTVPALDLQSELPPEADVAAARRKRDAIGRLYRGRGEN